MPSPNAPNLATFGGRLTWLRAEKGRRQGKYLSVDLAAAQLQDIYSIKLSDSRLNQLEGLGEARGRPTGAVQLEHLIALADYYQVTIDFLVKGPLRGVGQTGPPLGPTVIDEDGYKMVSNYSRLHRADKEMINNLTERLAKPTIPERDQ